MWCINMLYIYIYCIYIHMWCINMVYMYIYRVAKNHRMP